MSSYLTLVIALGIVALFGYWSGNRRRKFQKRQSSKMPKLYPLSKTERRAKLRRVK